MNHPLTPETGDTPLAPGMRLPLSQRTRLSPEAVAEIKAAAAKYPDREMAIVRLIVQPPTGNTSRDEVTRELKRLFPRWYSLEWLYTNSPTASDTPPKFSPRAGFETTIRDYLTEQLAHDPERAIASLVRMLGPTKRLLVVVDQL